MIGRALRTVGAGVIAVGVVAWLYVGRRDLKPANVLQRRPRTGPLH